MLKHLITLALAGVCVLAAGTAAADAVVFLYHRFGEDRYPTTSVRLKQFDAHLEYLDRHGFTVWPLQRIADYLRQGRAIPDRTAAITVDDAYLSVYTQAYPRLKARGWPFTVFVATGPVDRHFASFMSWEQMREMARNGASFANHGVSHDHLVRRRAGETEAAWRARMRGELDEAQRRLGKELGATGRLFAYPYGEFDEALAKVVESAGYTAFGQQSGAVGRYTDTRAVPRFPMSEAYAPIEQFANKVNSLALPVEQVLPWNPVIGSENPPSIRLQLAVALPRTREMRCYVAGQELAKVEWRDAQHATVRARAPLPRGRSRYNCTVPGPDGRYYWYSHPWLMLGRQG